MKVFIAMLGLACALGGAYLLLLVLAFASMIDPDIRGYDWWAEYLWKIRTKALPEVCLLSIMILGGAWAVRWAFASECKNPTIPEL